MIKLKVINDKVITKIPESKKDKDTRPIKGEDIFPLYTTAFLVARKNSGKTNLIWNILKQCITIETTVILYVSTVYNDPAWIAIREYLKKHKINVICHTSIKEGKVDKVDQLVKELEAEAKQREEEEAENKVCKKTKNILLCESDEDEEDQPKSKYQACKYFIVLDDLSDEIKSPSIVALIKKHRHFKSKVFVSSQYYKDLLPAYRANLDFFILFKNLTEDKLKVIYADANTVIPYEMFKKIYHYATKEPYSFLYINTRKLEYRKNFNVLIDIKDIEK